MLAEVVDPLDANGAPDLAIISHLFKSRYAINTHVAAPLFEQRVSYLRYLAEQGKQRKTLKDTAALLLHVVRVLGMQEQEKISAYVIKKAAGFWAEEVLPHRANRRKKSAARFYTAANGFLIHSHLKMEVDPLSCCFDTVFYQFREALFARGYRPNTVAAIAPPVKSFLFWFSNRSLDLSSMSVQHIHAYLNEGICAGWKPRTVVARCQALRNFFRFADKEGRCKAGFSKAITNPVIRNQDWTVSGPPWESVRRMIQMTGNSSVQDSRAKAILLLCCVYGLRGVEIKQLMIDAFDWKGACFTLQRAKNGCWQRFPITQELGEAVIHYVRNYRGCGPCRNLFVTLLPPYRPLQNLCPIVKKRMRVANVEAQRYGPHALRHSCATELLRQGTSLENIANLLGHRDLRSVSIYARYDTKTLSVVADFSLSEIL